jgi:hypothetical protein
MADKSSFTADEWKTLLESVMATGVAVTAAEPSGLWGLLQEGFASGGALARVKMDTASNPLLKALVDDLATSEGRTIARDGLKESLGSLKREEIKGACIKILQDAGSIVDAKAPADAATFKGWLRQISQSVAEAASEGGFLGFGGVPVSDAEKATLGEIVSALKLSA